MPRNKIERPIHPAPLLNEEVVRQDMAAMDTLAVLKEAYPDGRDMINQLLGQAQALGSSAQLLQTFGVAKLKYIKENKLYTQIAGIKTPNGLECRGTWVDFCGLLGISDQKANEDIANLNALGEEALESMTRMGIGYRELRQYRRLPADERLALIEAAKSGDKAELVDVAEIMISKHLKEAEKLTGERDEARKTADARETVIGAKEKLISRLQEQIAGKAAPEFAAEQALHDLDAEALGCAARIEVSLRLAMLAVNDAGATPALAAQALAAAVGRVLAAARQLAEDFCIATTGAEAAPEARDEAAEDAAIWAAVNAEMAAKAANHGAKN